MSKDNKKKSISLKEIIRQVDEQDLKDREEALKQAKRLEREQHDEYERKIHQDKIDLLKAKQGIEIEEEEEAKVEKRHYNIFQKIGQFIEYNRWWLILALFGALLIGFFIYQLATRDNPDVSVLMITDDSEMQACSVGVKEYFEQNCEDYNHDGKVQVSVYTLPLNKNVVDNDFIAGYASAVTTQLQMGKTLLIISDNFGNDYINSEEICTNLEEEFPDSKNTYKYGYYLWKTDFGKKIGYEGTIPYDICLEIREVKDDYSFAKEMSKNYNRAFPVLEKVINDLE